MTYIKVTLYCGEQPQGSFTQSAEELDLSGALDGFEPGSGDWYKLEAVEMTLDAYEALAEFQGF